MVLDQLARAALYVPLHPGFKAAFDYLCSTDFTDFPGGRREIDGERLFVVINRGKGKGRSGARLEAHQKYIDIQFTVSGTDDLGWKPTGECTDVFAPYTAEKDVAFFGDAPTAWIAVPPKSFVILFPDDAHAPMGADCDLLKAVVKVAVDWPA